MKLNEANILFVSGSFDNNGGKSSKVAEGIAKGLCIDGIKHINGGYFNKLTELLNLLPDYQVVLWFANVANELPKEVQKIKEINPHAVLVTSKRNVENKYGVLEIINRALAIKSNLVVEFAEENDKYSARVLDPLGNCFIDYTIDMEKVGKALAKRLSELLSFTRVGSRQVGKAIESPDEAEFYSEVKDYGEKFHELVHCGEEVTRFLGNASFRCERGFPSMRQGNLIFVSRRNVDKRNIGRDEFVAVEAEGEGVSYHGANKPSVDTPIQLKLYQHYKNVNYMLHSHVYIKDAPFTEKVVPCGALEEAKEIIMAQPDKNMSQFSVNLRGHGSIVFAKGTKELRNIEYYTRKLPEIIPNYIE